MFSSVTITDERRHRGGGDVRGERLEREGPARKVDREKLGHRRWEDAGWREKVACGVAIIGYCLLYTHGWR